MAAHVTYWGGASCRIGSVVLRRGRTVVVHDEDVIARLENDHRYTVERFVEKIIRKPVGEKIDAVSLVEESETLIEDTPEEPTAE